ncbi:bifunctional folylpolyglutamate synthase/dihydrofolate synthase [Novosphingobium panipatense]|uniref:Dihydrofolate synthase / folylpolyglutamate synthase n=1 Tax=Novosphingobium panipatense TaxID=428991 RepID=A0ABY1PZC5_9SPHN|nr:folylpolyglutamate synthase/dihydrofolate synthase family protein [Novosphingobium panipatense]SMP53872.1 dihydrofolate synthase / folylpolyglutamate synthase [Novosphingobium panipatense]
MRDFAVSDAPAVQAQLDRLAALSLPQGRIGLDAIRLLLARLGDPHLAIPPAFHVAGTNGKGSTCAFLRSILEAQGYTVHAITSPHLVRYNERIRIAGELIGDDELASLLGEVLDAAGGLEVSFFETTIAASFLAFARHRADACVIEVGLGGRFDATNVLPAPLVCGMATLGIDHERFLLAPEEDTPAEPLTRIAFEKAGIRRSHVPLVTQAYTPEVAAFLQSLAASEDVPLFARGETWKAQATSDALWFEDRDGSLTLPLPQMPGAHQADNATLAVAMLRRQDTLRIDAAAFAEGIRNARWPARMQLLSDGPLTALVPGTAVWLDGGHNRDAGLALEAFLREREIAPHLILGMIAGKDPAALLDPLHRLVESVTIVPVPGHECHASDAFADWPLETSSAPDVETALRRLETRNPRSVLIAGSLYLAGAVLRANGELPV